MGRFRATYTIVLDLESALDHEEANKQAETLLDKMVGDQLAVRKQVRLEKLRDRRCVLRLGEFKPSDILDYITHDEAKKDYKVGDTTYSVKMNSHRYFIFRESVHCAACGIEGSKMILEQNPSDKSPHFNLYAVQDGKLVLMTKDHVQPKAYGGEDRHSNYQTMCAICNNLKGAANLTLEGVKELRTIFNENRSLPRKKLREMLEDAKARLSLERTEPHVSKRRRKQHLAACKVGEHLICNTDIHIWQFEDGTLMGRSVYANHPKDATQVACIKHGTELEAIGVDHDKVICKCGETAILIYQGYLDIKEDLDIPIPIENSVVDQQAVS